LETLVTLFDTRGTHPTLVQALQKSPLSTGRSGRRQIRI